MENPYDPPQLDNSHSSEEEDKHPILSFLVSLIVFGLMFYGLVRLCQDTGFIVHWADGSAHFWFER